MIRSVLGLFIFAVALCAYIVTKPVEAPEARNPSATTEVTRAATQNLLPTAPLQDAISEAPGIEPVVVPVAPTPEAPGGVELPSARISTDESTISSTTSNVLAGLGLDLDLPEPEPQDEMAQMTSNVVASIGSITGRPSPSRSAAPDTALERLVVAAIKEGRTDAEIDEIVNAAAIAGDMSVPAVLVTANGRVDTAVLLKSIIVQATIAAGGAAPSVPETPTGDGSGVEVRVVQRAAETEQYRFYTVSEGDSLGAIAVMFYGNVDKFPVIFEANKNILSSPNRIKVGQRLAIPNLPEV